jgi:hypothetical protein
MHCSMYMGEAPSEAVWSGAFAVPYRVVLMSSGRWDIGCRRALLGTIRRDSRDSAATTPTMPPRAGPEHRTSPSIRPSHFCCSLAGIVRVHSCPKKTRIVC